MPGDGSLPRVIWPASWTCSECGKCGQVGRYRVTMWAGTAGCGGTGFSKQLRIHGDKPRPSSRAADAAGKYTTYGSDRRRFGRDAPESRRIMLTLSFVESDPKPQSDSVLRLTN
jgi:hypothetical protein